MEMKPNEMERVAYLEKRDKNPRTKFEIIKKFFSFLFSLYN